MRLGGSAKPQAAKRRHERRMTGDRDESLAQLLGALADEARRGRQPDVDAAAARHPDPNIVAVYDAGATDGQAYFSMQYVEGQTLAALMTAGPLRPHDAARYLAAVARAVHFGHERGILHRDLKPSNVLIDRD